MQAVVVQVVTGQVVTGCYRLIRGACLTPTPWLKEHPSGEEGGGGAELAGLGEAGWRADPI